MKKGKLVVTSNNAILDILFLIAPQYYTTDPIALDNLYAMIALVGNQVNQAILSCNYQMAYALLVAHYLTLQTNPNLGVYNNMHEGQLQLGINVSADTGFMQLTPYGRAYADLISRTVVGSTVTNLPPMLGGVASAYPVWCGCSSGYWQGSGGCGC